MMHYVTRYFALHCRHTLAMHASAADAMAAAIVVIIIDCQQRRYAALRAHICLWRMRCHEHMLAAAITRQDADALPAAAVMLPRLFTLMFSPCF